MGKLTQVDGDFLLLCAERHCIGKIPYIVDMFCDVFDKMKDTLGSTTLRVIREDIKSADYYDLIDSEKRWMKICEDIERILKRRKGTTK